MTAVSSVIPSPSPPPEILPTPSSLHSHTCVLCNKPTSLTCPECGNEYYCSEEHKVLDRPRHQFACASRASFNELASRWLNDTSGQDNERQAESLNEARTRSSRRNQSVSSKSESTVRPRAHTNRTKTGTRTGTPPTTDAGNDLEENQTIGDEIEKDEEEEGVMEPISTPSQLRSRPQTRRTTHSQPQKHSSKHKPPGVTVRAFLFPCAPPARPEMIDVTCTTLDTPFENTHHRPSFRVPLGLAKDQEVAFNTIPTYRGLFLLIRPVDVNQEMPINECISNIIMIEGGGPQEHVWRGNVLVLKESDPRSGLFGDIEEEDLDVLGAYFRLDGKVSLNSLTRTLNLPPSNPAFQLPPPSPSTSPAETDADTSTSGPSGNGFPFPRVHSHTPILRPMAPTPGMSTPHPRSSGSHPRTSGSRRGSRSRSRSRSRPESIIASLPIPQIPAAIFVDTILLPPSSPHPHILPLPCSPHILRPPRQVYESVLGPDPIFRRVETWAGDFLVGCRPRFAFEEDEDEEEGEGAGGNLCVKSLTNGRGSWKDWPDENILVVKLSGPYDPLPPPIPAEPGVGVRLAAVGAKNASMFDLAPLRRFFEFSGSMSESALKDFLSRP